MSPPAKQRSEWHPRSAVAPAWHWHFIESGDRWFQAYQRSLASSPRCLGDQVTRWNVASLAGLPAVLKQPGSQSQTHAMIWEFPLAELDASQAFEWLVTLRQHNRRVIHLAHALPETSSTTLRVLQEAGVSIWLPELWALQRLIGRVKRAGG